MFGLFCCGNQTSVLSRFGLCRQSSGRRKQRPQIEAPWRIECQQNTGNVDGGDEARAVNGCGGVSKVGTAHLPDPVECWPSITNLHCIGWAKVIASYAAQRPHDLTLLEGESTVLILASTIYPCTLLAVQLRVQIEDE